MPEVPEVGAFLLGAPKCGTTWLAEVLAQHPEICVSDPKEPNIVASHKGTFGRDVSEPDWVELQVVSMGVVYELIVRFMQWLALLLSLIHI